MIDFFNWPTVWLSKISMAKGSVSSKLAIQQHSVISVEDIVGGFKLMLWLDLDETIAWFQNSTSDQNAILKYDRNFSNFYLS